jgi:hypothetical protein
MGLILDESLTGRPAFARATAGETIEQVTSHEPIPLNSCEACDGAHRLLSSDRGPLSASESCRKTRWRKP